MTQLASPTQTYHESHEHLRLPDFCIIGAAKSATTSLFSYLCRHPDVFMCEPKEPEFFSRNDRFARGPNWYASLFTDARPEQVVGEASTTYTRWPHTPDVARRLTQMLPDAKLIYLMRHPIERAYSHYRHHMRFGVTKTFEQALRDDDIYVDCSLYMMQIRRYLQFIPREQMHFVLLSDLKEDPARVLREAQTFLDLPERDLMEDEPVVANQSNSRHYLRHRLRALCSHVPGIVPLADRLPDKVKDAVYSAITLTPPGRRMSSRVNPPAMQKQTRYILLERFREPNQELAEFLDRDLSAWEQ